MTVRADELFLIGFRGMSLPDWVREFEDRFGLGGIILFDYDVPTRSPVRNVESPDQVRALCNEIHSMPSRPLVFIDQEGGRVRRLKTKRGFADLPSAADFARLPVAQRRELAEASYGELVDIGIDFNLAPVVDLDLNPANPNIGAIGRSFSAEPDVVRDNVALLNQAARRVGLALCLKHYPGLGGATTDSHEELTDLTGRVPPLQIALFRELWDSLCGRAILLSHGLDRECDPDWPVSISARSVADLRSWAPDALLISDDLQMQALQALCSTSDACLRGARAGIDLCCIGNNLLLQEDECLAAAERLGREAGDDAALARKIADARERVAVRKRAAAARTRRSR